MRKVYEVIVQSGSYRDSATLHLRKGSVQQAAAAGLRIAKQRDKIVNARVTSVREIAYLDE